MWRILRSWEHEDGSKRFTWLLQRYSQPAQGQPLLARLAKDSKLAALEMAAQLMYGKTHWWLAWNEKRRHHIEATPDFYLMFISAVTDL